MVSESDLDFGASTLHQHLLRVTRVDGGPALFARVPLEDDFDGIDATVGMVVPLGRKE